MNKEARKAEPKVMSDEGRWELAERLERCALGWEVDASRYLGVRRETRITRANYLRLKMYELLRSIS